MCTTTFATLRWTNTSPGREADDLVGGHAAVGAADPEVLGRLRFGEALEEARVVRDHRGGPGAVVLEELGEVGHGDRLSVRVGGGSIAVRVVTPSDTLPAAAA